jgi:hypothetical protein
VRLSSSIVANSASGGNCSGFILSQGDNISSDATCVSTNAILNDRNNLNPLLAAAGLQNNGGPTRTIALQPTSPALNAVKKACPATDQRGLGRPATQCDIGAFENFPLFLTINNVTLAEGNSVTKTFVFTVRLSLASANTVTVNYATANGSAVAGSDYTAVPSTWLTFTPGQTSKQVVVNVKGDTVVEPNETFVVNLGSASGATIYDGLGLGTITNDD